jgi:hypothetical protein
VPSVIAVQRARQRPKSQNPCPRRYSFRKWIAATPPDGAALQ